MPKKMNYFCKIFYIYIQKKEKKLIKKKIKGNQTNVF